MVMPTGPGSTAESGAQALALAHSGPTQGLRDGYLYTSIRQGSWITVAAIPRAEELSILLWHSLYMLPLGALLAGASVSGIVRI